MLNEMHGIELIIGTLTYIAITLSLIVGIGILLMMIGVGVYEVIKLIPFKIVRKK